MSLLPLHLVILEVNVGLLIGRSAEEISANFAALLIAKAVGSAPLTWATILGDGEPTYYASFLVSASGLDAVLERVAVACGPLGQEAIALRHGDSGTLVGPMAAEWGPFNADYFKVPTKVLVAA